MNATRASASMALLLLLMAVSAASPRRATVSVPSSDHTRTQRLPSPDGRFVLVGTTVRTDLPTQKCPTCYSLDTKLWIEDNASHARRLLLAPGSSAEAGWSPDGSAFFVNDREASDEEFAYLYGTGDLKKVDLEKVIMDADPGAKRFFNGHFYFDVDNWLNKDTVQVSLRGHTDKAPVKCFLLRYRVSRSGVIQKLLQRERLVDGTLCAWTD